MYYIFGCLATGIASGGRNERAGQIYIEKDFVGILSPMHVCMMWYVAWYGMVMSNDYDGFVGHVCNQHNWALGSLHRCRLIGLMVVKERRHRHKIHLNV